MVALLGELYLVQALMNRIGNLVKRGTTGLFYCGKYIGADRLPHSDGYCGPTNGPQCEDCRTFQIGVRCPLHPLRCYRSYGVLLRASTDESLG